MWVVASDLPSEWTLIWEFLLFLIRFCHFDLTYILHPLWAHFPPECGFSSCLDSGLSGGFRPQLAISSHQAHVYIPRSDPGCSTMLFSAYPTWGCWKPQVDETKAQKQLEHLRFLVLLIKDKEKGFGWEDLQVTLISPRGMTAKLPSKENMEGKVIPLGILGR